MPSNTPDPEQHKGDSNDEEEKRDTIPDGRVRPDADADGDDEVIVERVDEDTEEELDDDDIEDAEDIDVDELPESEGPDA